MTGPGTAGEGRHTQDPRRRRITAAILAALLLVATVLALTGISTRQGGSETFGWFAYQPLPGTAFGSGGPWAISSVPLTARAADAGVVAVLVMAALLLWGALAPRSAPVAVLVRAVVPRRTPARDEHPRRTRIAQALACAVAFLGVVLHLAAVPWALPLAAAVAFAVMLVDALRRP